MSEEMAVSDNATGEDAKEQSIDTALEDAVEAMDGPSEQPAEETPQEPEESKQAEESNPDTTKQPNPIKNKIEIDIKKETDQLETKQDNEDIIKDEFEVTEHKIEGYLEDDKKGMKRRASEAFSDDDVEFKGFEDVKQEAVVDDYSQVLERLEAEVSAASKMFTPVRHVMATPAAPVRASKRPRKDTGMSDGSRPSSAQSSRSEDDNPSMSPAGRGRGRVDPQSPLLRVPLARGWRRELVYRAALDAHSRRNADIYYYTPHGKKLRSTREVAEHLSGTGLTLENFSFFKEPLGVDDPEKEIIRDAKLMRRLESPVTSPAPLAVDGKRTPKPKQPKGASPEPTPKSPPSRLKVKSVGSRVSTPAPAPKQQKKAPPPAPTATPTATPQATPTATPAPTTNDNNNSAAWKKPRAPPPGPAPPPAPAAPPSAPPPAPPPPARTPSPPARPQPDLSSPDTPRSRLALQPCSLSCGGGVPSLSCGACLCLYHPVCAGHPPHLSTDNFLCKNCRKPSPERSPPAPAPRRLSTTSSGGSETRVLLRMKVSAGGAGERVWAVAGARAPPPAPRAPPPAPRPPPLARSLPQSLASINGRREDKRRTRVSNGTAAGVAVTPAPPPSPRRRGRPRLTDETDHFTPFTVRAKDTGFDVALQIFQYLGMRDLAHCARVCKLWQQLASTPALWRHVRMKNSHVSDWGGLCAALKRHGTKWLDLRKMLLPQNDTLFWDQFAVHIATVDTLERLEMCRCPSRAVEAACGALPALAALSALAIRDGALDPRALARAAGLRDLRLKSMAGLALAHDLTPLARLHRLTHLSLTSIKELGWRACDVIGSLPLLESLELGECSFRAEFAGVLARLRRLRRLRLERGTAHCAAPDILRAVARLPLLARLELVNIDVKVGFDDALAECKNIQRLLIIPTYVSQSATTNKQVLSGVLRLKESLTHLMWGVTIELLRVTELFIDQCSAGGGPRRELGECIPVLKPVPGCRLPMDHQLVAGPPQVEILPLPTLQRLLSAQLPNTKLKLLRIPFHATWRQSLADFQ